MIELTINLIHKFELILFMAVDFIDETMFKTYFFRKICRFTLCYFCYIIRNVLKLLLYEKKHGIKKNSSKFENGINIIFYFMEN